MTHPTPDGSEAQDSLITYHLGVVVVEEEEAEEEEAVEEEAVEEEAVEVVVEEEVAEEVVILKIKMIGVLGKS